MKFGVIVFPGSNCDHDCYYVLKKVFRQDVDFIWHKEEDLSNFDAIVLPGGFSYGDYLRTGAIARFSPVMSAVVEFADTGGIVMGICNGFQILCEAGLLPGAFMRNRDMRFVCKFVKIRVENNDSIFTRAFRVGDVLRVPVAHGDGLYYADQAVLDSLNGSNRVLFRYCIESGEITEDANPNGSLENIAGIINEHGNVMGMMPHPERCSEAILTSADGANVFNSIIQNTQHVSQRTRTAKGTAEWQKNH
ncbi:phosphoribosylformylglycinamidine synthase subunit PurQ [candidate division KSB1 bacterium]|nr:phosphoribosylformylglycinamidine synthase subunit PurQ [candidate division KSB1 bacterium]NIR70146.1 phosphoribosylformylglycinamidine synthase subunit PurQ [candidate division KSB1 bacterium]NIS28058.1 phosphoribosylformylglycinamidine synthase subunit PurQ [candidate division KSB1 bacterium]NIT74927.1 phosphoribosylformylglycinamidine synthase subunit PurQ [candidate division KSB1 bacterium]NIU28711.1 phosphoribosylformylglycinamidine synthase subunit PurQ [candidate division KSB1 bacteri